MKLLHAKNQIEDKYVKKVYQQIIFLAILVHASYIVIFASLSFFWLCFYNIGSVIFYFIMLLVVHKKHYRTAVTVVHAEVCLFVTMCILMVGWNMGFPLYLIALASLVYFCPFDHKYVPYLFSAIEIYIFFILRFYTNYQSPYYTPLHVNLNIWFYIYNACACFAIILYAAFLSGVSAKVSKKKLQDENENLTALANYDQLTGLLSRYAFFQRFSQKQKGNFVLVIGDVDDFKKINDTYGHVCGDYVLHAMAELLRKECGAQADICRWGGEEFLFLFSLLPLPETKQKVQNLCDTIAQHAFLHEGIILHVTMTFGLCEGNEEKKIEQLIEQADGYMYAGKMRGKNCVVAEEAE